MEDHNKVHRHHDIRQTEEHYGYVWFSQHAKTSKFMVTMSLSMKEISQHAKIKQA